MAVHFNINYEFDPARVLERIDEAVANGRSGYVCVADGNILQMVHRNLEYRKVVNGAMFSICDSSWVPVYLKRLHGMEVGQYCGSDIFRDIVSSGKYRMCFLGSSSPMLKGLKSNLSTQLNPFCEGMLFKELPFCSAESFDYKSIAEEVKTDGADIVWVSLGAPKQEIFASRLVQHLHHGIVIPVGAVFNFYSGAGIDRAPELLIRHHLEFAYRIAREPRKQLRRCRRILTSLPGILKEESGKR